MYPSRSDIDIVANSLFNPTESAKCYFSGKRLACAAHHNRERKKVFPKCSKCNTALDRGDAEAGIAHTPGLIVMLVA
jgi:hypothetical protein